MLIRAVWASEWDFDIAVMFPGSNNLRQSGSSSCFSFNLPEVICDTQHRLLRTLSWQLRTDPSTFPFVQRLVSGQPTFKSRREKKHPERSVIVRTLTRLLNLPSTWWPTRFLSWQITSGWSSEWRRRRGIFLLLSPMTAGRAASICIQIPFNSTFTELCPMFMFSEKERRMWITSQL